MCSRFYLKRDFKEKLNRTEEYLRMEPELLIRDQDAGQISMFL